MQRFGRYRGISELVANIVNWALLHPLRKSSVHRSTAEPFEA